MRARARAGKDARNEGLPSRAWSFSFLARYAPRTKKKETARSLPSSLWLFKAR